MKKQILKSEFKKFLAASVTWFAVMGAFQAAHADTAPAAGCDAVIAKLHQDFRIEHRERVAAAEKFVRRQAEVLRILRSQLSERDLDVMRQMMHGALGAPAEKASEYRASVYHYNRGLYEDTAEDFDDTACDSIFAHVTINSCYDLEGSESPTSWTRRMVIGVETPFQDGFGARACTEVYHHGNALHRGTLKVCTLLDLASNRMWGESVAEAMQLGGSFVDAETYVETRIQEEFPVCARTIKK